MSLSPQQRDELRRLLAEELRAAWQAAAEDPAPTPVVAEAEDRLRAVEERRRVMRSAAAAARTGGQAEAAVDTTRNATLDATEPDEPS